MMTMNINIKTKMVMLIEVKIMVILFMPFGLRVFTWLLRYCSYTKLKTNERVLANILIRKFKSKQKKKHFNFRPKIVSWAPFERR